MIAGLLFLIGLVSAVVSIAMAGVSAPAALARFTAAMNAGNANLLELAGTLLAGYAWAVGPIVGGLVLMGLARVIMLLGAINRSLRGQP